MENLFKSFDRLFNQYLYKSMPKLSKGVRATIEGALPWFVLVMSIFAVFGMFATLGLGAIASPFMILGKRSFTMFWLSWGVAAVQLVLEVMAIPGLFNKRRAAWMLLYYSNTLGLLMSIISFSVGGIILALFLIYVLYQVKSSYTK